MSSEDRIKAITHCPDCGEDLKGGGIINYMNHSYICQKKPMEVYQPQIPTFYLGMDALQRIELLLKDLCAN